MRTFEKLLEGSKWTICTIVTGIAIVLLGSITFGAGYYVGLMDCKGNRQGRRNRVALNFPIQNDFLSNKPRLSLHYFLEG